MYIYSRWKIILYAIVRVAPLRYVTVPLYTQYLSPYHRRVPLITITAINERGVYGVHNIVLQLLGKMLYLFE